jgi:hypothetical protein
MKRYKIIAQATSIIAGDCVSAGDCVAVVESNYPVHDVLYFLRYARVVEQEDQMPSGRSEDQMPSGRSEDQMPSGNRPEQTEKPKRRR